MKTSSNTPSQDRLAAQAARSERYAALAAEPTTPWLLGKLAAIESFRQRPTKLESWLARTGDALLARSVEIDERSKADLQNAIGRLRRLRAGEPDFVPASVDVMQAQFLEEQAVPHQDQ